MVLSRRSHLDNQHLISLIAATHRPLQQNVKPHFTFLAEGVQAINRLHEIKRFSLVGIFNTCLGTVLIFLFQAFTSNPTLGNFLGYLIVVPINYVFHARYSFRSEYSKRGLIIFIIVYSLSYLVNLSVLVIASKFISTSAAQILAIAAYVCSSYIMQAKIVFPRKDNQSRYSEKNPTKNI